VRLNDIIPEKICDIASFAPALERFEDGMRWVCGIGSVPQKYFLDLLAQPAITQPAFPNRPLKIIVPVAAGGISDTISRYLAETMRADLGQPVVVDNRPGANGILASEVIARSPADGYTVGYMLYAAMTLNPLLIPNLSYRMTDFLPLTPTFKAPMVLAVGRNVPVSNVREFVGYVKRQGNLSYGTLGNASTGQILMEMLRGLTGIDLENVGYRGETLAVTDPRIAEGDIESHPRRSREYT
jgi:tripartite-type tricarboxylate transporter receptor subunit TctC